MTYATDAFQVSSSARPKSLQSLNDIKAVEICFEEHEIYVGDRAMVADPALPIAKIILTDEDFETQPWVVIINGIEIHRANTWAKCFHFITWHFTQGTLPQQQQEIAATEKEPMVLPIFTSQQKSKQFAMGKARSKTIAEAQSATITTTKLIQKVYAKCVEILPLSIQYLFLLLRTPEKFLRKKRIIN